MKNTIYFIAGILFTALISATTVTIMNVKPVTPKVTIVKSFRTMYGLENDILKFTTEKVRQGYIVKSIAMMDDESISKGVVVLEKY
ncbi:MAG: hypothetical protein RIQ59_540 [Bacteroidota bacterium]|jgi:hypothetical protein